MIDDGVRARDGSASRLWSMVAAVVLVLVGAAGAWRAAVTGADFMYDLEQPRSPLARSEPVIVDPHTRRLSDHVVLVIVDGLRWDASRKMRYLATLRAAGVDSHATSHYPTWSRPNYVSILTGVPPQASGVRTNRHYTPVSLDSLMDRVHAAGLHSASASDASPLPALFLRPVDPAQKAAVDKVDIDVMLDKEEDDDIPPMPELELRSPFDDGRYTPWPGGLVDAVREQLAAGHDLQVILISMVDNAGHAHGADSREYADAVQVADRTLARVLPALDLAHDTIIVTADHGHTGPGGHGGLEPEVLYVPLVVVGAGVRPGALPLDARLIDLAPTAAALLGIPAPGHGLGRTLTEILDLTPAEVAARQQADATRLAVTEKVVRDSRAQSLLDELRHRGRRLFSIAAVGGGLVALALWLRRRRGVIFAWRSLALGVPVFFVVYYAMIAALGQRFSPSFLPERGHIALELAKYGVIGVVAHVVVGWLVLRRRHDLAERLALANGNALVGLGLTMVPAGLMWAFFPPPYVEVPGPRLLVLIPAVQVALALYAIAILLALLVEVVVFFA
ncbi:MAG TPA: alkaline phosphatase family protein, partial [Kofleriaceae bacterium]|nr:alkaline phosphatase family protein [Kofleriaceae bacterium]